ncbi:MAG: DUF72 domain-containing protein [Myxococcota bacterium]
MRVFVGTSGFSYGAWKGKFYPAELPAKKMLAFYASRFRAVEINNTFYRMPKREMLAKWGAQVPDGFTFVLKAWQRITHQKRLKDASEETRTFFDTASALGEKLGPALFQLPPFLRADVPRLRDFLATLPAGARVACEFRHASWFCDETYDALRAAGAALCIAEDEKLATPLVATAPWGTLRLRRPDYDDAALAAWADRVRAQHWSDAFVFFKHEDEAKGPALAERFALMLGGKQPDGARVIKRGTPAGSRAWSRSRGRETR